MRPARYQKEGFLESMRTFKGAKKRQELIADNGKTMVYLDFAHAPSKVKATVDAFREMFPDKKLTACLEIHTFSSLNKTFLPQYMGTMDRADEAALFYNPEVVAHKQMEALSPEFIRKCFALPRLKVFDHKEELEEYLRGKIFDRRSSSIDVIGKFFRDGSWENQTMTK